MLLGTGEIYRLNGLPWVPVPAEIAPAQSGSWFVDVSFDELGLEDKVPWTIRVSPHGSVYCSLQHSYATDSETWYNLQVGGTESVRLDDCYEFNLDNVFCGVEAYARRVWSIYSQDSGDLKQTGGHKLISSRAVSMAGHLRYLVPTYEQDSLEAKVKEEVVHIENVTLAEEHGHLNRLRVAVQTLRRLGWSVCKTWLQRRSLALGMPYWPTLFSCLCSACGIDFAVRV
jgi:hypothetical protein